MKIFLLTFTCVVITLLMIIIVKADSRTPMGSCKTENAECSINESGKECCEGLVCVPFNPASENGKCSVTLSVTPTGTPTYTPIPVTTAPICQPTIVIDKCNYTLNEQTN